MHESSAGGEEVVVDQNNVILIDGITVEFYGIDTIFLGVCLLDGNRGSFPGLRAGTNPHPRLYAITEPPMKPRGFYTDNFCYSLVSIEICQGIAHQMQSFPIFKQSCKVRKMIPFDGKSGISRIFNLKSSISILFALNYKNYIFGHLSIFYPISSDKINVNFCIFVTLAP